MGHEYCGIVEEVGRAVTEIKPGQFVVGSFFASDNTCAICRAGYQSRCVHAFPMGREGAQAPFLRVPLADGTLVATPELPSERLVPGLLSASDVLGTGWFGAEAAAVAPGKTVAIVGDGAVGLCAVIAAKQMGSERIIMMSRHEDRQRLAREFGASEIVTERGDEGITRIKDMTDGLGAHSVIEAVGTQESMMQAIHSTRPGGHVGFVGVAHGVAIPGVELFFAEVHLHGGPAPVRKYLPQLIDLVLNRTIDPGKVFDLTLAARPGGGGLPGDERAPCDQSTARPGTLGTEAVKIRMEVGGTPLAATLDDTETARDFASLLPLTLTLDDYAATEKISDLPRRLTTAGAPVGAAASAGDISYYAPWGNLALFYRDSEFAGGLVRLGRIDGDAGALRRRGPLTAKIERI